MGNACVVASHEDDDIFCATDEQNESLFIIVASSLFIIVASTLAVEG